MSATTAVADAVGKQIESARSVANDQLSVLSANQSGKKRTTASLSITALCYSFFYDICKHQIAARLAAALGACVEVKVSDEQLALLL